MQGLRRRLRQSFAEFFALESSGGMVLIAAAVVALVLANSSIAEPFSNVLAYRIGADFSSVDLELSIKHWINDGLMAIFFLVVGLEIKRELLVGELSSRQRAALPIAAAIGGMLIPALLYACVCQGTPEIRGWGIPMATDIAFSLGVLALLGSRAPIALKVFLAALAIVDDIGAVLVIACFYSDGIAWEWLGIGLGLVALLAGAGRIGVKSLFIYLAVGALVWICFLQSGVHATVAGVLVAFTIPTVAKNPNDPSPLERLEHALHPVQTYGIVPAFALANAGVSLSGFQISHMATGMPLGILAGLVLGKPIGILAACYVAVRSNLAELPHRTSWRQILGAGMLAGIGFTMSLFIAELAFAESESLSRSKLAILGASAISALLGFIVLQKERGVSSSKT